MKLPIEDEYYQQIEKGDKIIDYRAAHITFINKKNGRKCFRNITRVFMMPRKNLPRELNKDTLFGDDKHVIAFELEKEK